MQQQMRIGGVIVSGENWCIDADTRDNIIARRNVLMGMWAGRLLGKSGDALADYARETHFADLEVPGDSDIIAKLASDLAGAGLAVERSAIRQHLSNFRRQAFLESVATD